MKTIILSFLIILGTTNPVIASVFNFDGVWNIYDGDGNQQNLGDDPASGFVDFDPLSGTGIGGQIDGQQVWQGILWSTTNFTITPLTGNTYEVKYFWSGFGSANVVNVWEIDSLGPDSFSVTTLDGDGDGIPGNIIDNGSWPGFSMEFNGTLTVVPVPAAVWLFGSGLLSLVAMARRKKTQY
jgi:hypothetical protein